VSCGAGEPTVLGIDIGLALIGRAEGVVEEVCEDPEDLGLATEEVRLGYYWCGFVQL
jgi:hypothetical protein